MNEPRQTDLVERLERFMGLSEDTLAIFDLNQAPKDEERRVRKIAKDLLRKLEGSLAVYHSRDQPRLPVRTPRQVSRTIPTSCSISASRFFRICGSFSPAPPMACRSRQACGKPKVVSGTGDARKGLRCVAVAFLHHSPSFRFGDAGPRLIKRSVNEDALFARTTTRFHGRKCLCTHASKNRGAARRGRTARCLSRSPPRNRPRLDRRRSHSAGRVPPLRGLPARSPHRMAFKPGRAKGTARADRLVLHSFAVGTPALRPQRMCREKSWALRY